MSVLLVRKDDTFWMGRGAHSFTVGKLSKDVVGRKVHLQSIVEDAVILDARQMKPVTVKRLFHKFSNGMGSIEAEVEPDFIDAFVLAGAKQVQVEDLL